MIKYHTGKLKKEEENIIRCILNNLTDIYSDFYITKNNLRLFLKENLDLLSNMLQKGDKIVYAEDKGVVFITGWSDRANRKYIKILAKDEESADKLLKIVNWNIDEQKLFAKIKKNNPIRRVLQRNNFRFCGDRGKEILLVKEINYFDTKAK